MLAAPCVCAGGIDASGGAGLAADARALRRMGCEPLLVKTAWTEQDSGGLRAWTPAGTEAASAALRAACAAYPAAPVKLGMLGGSAMLRALAEFLLSHQGPIVIDPVTGPSAGGSWIDEGYRAAFLELVPEIDAVITPNLDEARWLSDLSGADADACLQRLRELGFGKVVITGSKTCIDLIAFEQRDPYRLSGQRAEGQLRGTGCTYASSFAGALALSLSLDDATVVAKLGTVAGIKQQEGFPSSAAMPVRGAAPAIASAFLEGRPGVCPIVDSAARIPALASAGARWAQLRCKLEDRAAVEAEITKAAALARASGISLIVDDHWAYCSRQQPGFVAGVHLGQEDLQTADLDAIHAAGLLLGISAHNYAEAAAAMAAGPGYVSFGPIHPTMSKQVVQPPLGVDWLRRMCAGLPVPAIAIGGMRAERLAAVAACGVAGVAAIEAAASTEGLRELCAAWDEATGSRSGPD